MNERDIAEVLSRQRQAKENVIVKYRGVIVEQTNSTGQESIHIENRPLYVWVRLWNTQGSVVPCWNDRVAAYDGATVWVAPVPGSFNELEIIGVDRETFQGEDSPNVNLINPLHASAHEWPDGDPGLDVVTVYPRSWSQLRVYPQDPLSLLVNVSPLTYAYGNNMVTYGGGFIDLTAVEATLAAGEARLVLVYLDLATNTLSSTNGAIGADAGGWFLGEPAVTDATYPSAVVRIHEGQTEIDEGDIRDRRMFLNGSPGSDRDWPYDTEILSVDSTDVDADYATFTAANAAAAAGNLILISPESFTCDDETLPNDVDLFGWDKTRSVLTTVAQNTALTIGSDSYLRDIQVTITRNVAADIQAVKITNDNCTLEHTIMITTQSGAGDSYGVFVDGAVDNLRIVDCRMTGSTSGGGSDYGLYIDDGASVQEIQGGYFNGGTADVFVGSGSEVYLFGPILANGTIAGTGDKYGWYYDEAGKLYTISADMVMEDNTAAALKIVDKGGLNLLEFDTTNAQPSIIVNQGGADVDTRAEAVGAPNALVVQGSNGAVGIGTNAPATQLHVYHATNDVSATFETDKVNGFALNEYANDVQTWNFGVNTLDQFQIRDGTAGATVLTVAAGTPAQAVALTATQIVFNNAGVDLNLRWEGNSEDKLLLGDAGNDEVRIGDGDTNYFVTNKLGDTWWVGGGGLHFGEIYASDVADTIAIAAAGQANKVQITSFAVNGLNNRCSPDQANDHILILVAGIYLCTCSISARSAAAGGADTFGFAVYKNNGANEFVNLHAHRDLSGGGGDAGSISISGLIDLAVNDTIEVWVWNEDSTDDIVIDDITLSLVQIGGT